MGIAMRRGLSPARPPLSSVALTASLLIAACPLFACQDSTVDAPRPFVGAPIENLVSCSELRAAPLSVEDGIATNERGPAGCASAGLLCPVELPSHLAPCPAGEQPVAHCLGDYWRVLCQPYPGGGGAGGGDAGAGGARTHEAGAAGRSGP